MSWFNRKKVPLRESKGAALVEPGELTMTACISRFEGTEITNPAAFCQYMRLNRVGYFAKGYTGSLESMKEKERAAYSEQLRNAVGAWERMRPTDRAMYRPENDAMLKTSIPADAAGPLMRVGARPMESDGGKIDNVFSFSLSEAKVDREKREIRCHVISEGKGNARDNRYYGPESIADTARLLNGARSFINHPGRKEETDRPEGDLWDQCGFWKNAKVVEVKGKSAVRAVLVCDKSAAGNEALAKAEAAIEYAREFPGLTEDYAGISINGQGEIEEREIDGETVNYVAEVTTLPRADVVTQPARGGKFLGLVESIRSSNKSEGVAIMDKALKDAIASFTESLKGVMADKTTTPEAVLKMLTESHANISKLAGIKEADEKKDEKKDDKKADEADDEEKDEKKADEADDEEKDDEKKAKEMDDEEKDDEEMGESKSKKGAKESKAAAENRDLRKQLKEEQRRRKSIEGKVNLTETAKAITEAGLEGLIEAKDLTDIPPAQRAAQIRMLKAMREASPFGVPGTTLKGVGAGDSAKPGSAFMSAFKAAAGNRGARG